MRDTYPEDAPARDPHIASIVYFGGAAITGFAVARATEPYVLSDQHQLHGQAETALKASKQLIESEKTMQSIAGKLPFQLPGYDKVRSEQVVAETKAQLPPLQRIYDQAGSQLLAYDAGITAGTVLVAAIGRYVYRKYGSAMLHRKKHRPTSIYILYCQMV